MSNNNQQSINNNNNDIRCGLLMEVRVNCNYITQLYCDYNSEGSYEFTYIGKNEEEEERYVEAFWGEYNRSIVSVLEEPHKYREEGMEQELIYRFEECLENWNDIIMRNLCEEESDSEEEEEEDDFEDMDIDAPCDLCKEHKSKDKIVYMKDTEQVVCMSGCDEEEEQEEATCELCMETTNDPHGEWFWDNRNDYWICQGCISNNEEYQYLEAEWYNDSNTGIAVDKPFVYKPNQNNVCYVVQTGYMDCNDFCECFNECYSIDELVKIYKEMYLEGDLMEIYIHSRQIVEDNYKKDMLVIHFTTQENETIKETIFHKGSPMDKLFNTIEWEDSDHIDSVVELVEVEL